MRGSLFQNQGLHIEDKQQHLQRQQQHIPLDDLDPLAAEFVRLLRPYSHPHEAEEDRRYGERNVEPQDGVGLEPDQEHPRQRSRKDRLRAIEDEGGGMVGCYFRRD